MCRGCLRLFKDCPGLSRQPLFGRLQALCLSQLGHLLTDGLVHSRDSLSMTPCDRAADTAGMASAAFHRALIAPDLTSCLPSAGTLLWQPPLIDGVSPLGVILLSWKMHGMMPPLYSAADHGVTLLQESNQDVFLFLATHLLTHTERNFRRRGRNVSGYSLLNRWEW